MVESMLGCSLVFLAGFEYRSIVLDSQQDMFPVLFVEIVPISLEVRLISDGEVKKG